MSLGHGSCRRKTAPTRRLSAARLLPGRLLARAAGLALIGAYAALCEAPIETQIEQFRSIYEKNGDVIRKRHDDSLAEWPKAYALDLKSLQKKAQTAGDLESWMSIQSELERFERERLVRPANLVREPALLLELQQRYLDNDTKIEKARSDDLAALTEKYLAALMRLQAGLTKAGQIQDALKVNEEIKRTQATSIPDGIEPTGEEPAPTDDTGGGIESQPQASALVRTGIGAFTAFTGGVPPPISGVALKSFQLRRSESMKGEPMAAIAAEVGAAQQAAARPSTEYVPYLSRDGARIYYLRLSLKPTEAAGPIAGARLFVQYYAADASETDSGRYTRVCEDVTTLPEIPTQGMVVECPPVEVRGPSSGPAGSAGQELCGLVATIFDSNLAVIAQVASSPTLGKLASQSYPSNADEIAARRAYDEARELFYKTRSKRAASPGDPDTEAAYEKAREAYYSAQKAYQSKRAGAR
jgi:hypothetical protein